MAGSRLEPCCACAGGRQTSAGLELGGERSSELNYHWCELVRTEYLIPVLLLQRGKRLLLRMCLSQQGR